MEDSAILKTRRKQTRIFGLLFASCRKRKLLCRAEDRSKVHPFFPSKYSPKDSDELHAVISFKPRPEAETLLVKIICSTFEVNKTSTQ